MDSKKLGGQTVAFAQAPVAVGYGNVAGKKESDGPLGQRFDATCQDDYFGEKSWEKAERAMQEQALQNALKRAGKNAADLDFLLAGDLLNQCISSSFAARSAKAPFLGLYGACSTMGESLLLAAMLIDGGFGTLAAAVTSSHFCTAERQYRTPVAYGGQRTPTAQWTVTGAGAVILSRQGNGPKVTHATVGKIVDKGITDANNMGAAMAPAAAATLTHYLRDTHTSPQDFDTIYTGDLGRVGSELLAQLLADEGLALPNHEDCGKLLYDAEAQQTHSGGSGAGCCAGVLCSHILPALAARKKRRVLFIATGALMSQTTFLQKESIPTVAHLVELAAE
jgi:stage V sporulation protein AD